MPKKSNILFAFPDPQRGDVQTQLLIRNGYQWQNNVYRN